MNKLNSSDKACGKVRLSMDIYVTGECAEKSENEIRRHLQTCPPCSKMFEERAHVKHLVQRAVRREAVPESLKRKTQESIRKN